jgi:hypothetical protein
MVVPTLNHGWLNSQQLFAAVVATGEPKFDYKKLAVIMGPGENSSMPTVLDHCS